MNQNLILLPALLQVYTTLIAYIPGSVDMGFADRETHVNRA